MKSFNPISNSLTTRKSHDSFSLKTKMAYEKEIDILRTELSRKSEKNDRLVKEVVELRTVVLSQEKDFKHLSNSFNVILKEKDSLLLETINSNNFMSTLQAKLILFEDIDDKAMRLRDNQAELAFASREISRLSIELDAKNEIIRKLNHDCAVLDRTVNTMHINEHDKGLSGISNGRAMMRSLYTDIGKKQVDIHNLTISLSDFKQCKDELQTELDSKTYAINNLSTELFEEREKSRKWELKYKLDTEDKDLLSQKLAKSISSNAELDSKIIAASKKNDELESAVRGLAESLDCEKADTAALRETLQTLESSIIQRDERYKTTERTLLWDNKNLKAEIMSLQSRVDSVDDILKENILLREKLQVFELQEQKYSSVLTVNDKLSLRVTDLESSIEMLTRRSRALARERDDAIASLQQVMQSTRELAEQLLYEKDEKSILDSRNAELEKSLNDVNFMLASTLDSLSQEKLKTNSKFEERLKSSPIAEHYNCMNDLKSSVSSRYDANISKSNIETNRSNSSTQTLLTSSPGRTNHVKKKD